MVKHITLDEDEKNDKVWVDITKETIVWQKDYERMPIFTFADTFSEINRVY